MNKRSAIKTRLQPHQRRVVDKLLRNNLLIAHEMGAGKTLSSIAAAEALGLPTTVLAPPRLTSQYLGQVDTHTGGEGLSVPIDVHSIDTAVGRNSRIRGGRFIVVDEAHGARNPNTARSEYLTKRLVGGSKPGRVALLTGTPMYNKPSDLAPLINLVRGPEFEPISHKSFTDQFVEEEQVSPGFWGRLRGIKPGTVARLKDREGLLGMLEGYVDVHKKRGEGFPETKDEDVNVDMSEEQQELYRYLERGIPDWLQTKISTNMPPSKSELKSLNAFLVGLRQVSLSAAPYREDLTPLQAAKRSPKLTRAFKDLAERVKKDKNFRGVVYSNFLEAGLRPFAALLKERGIPYAMYHGGLSKEQGRELVEKYNNGEIKVLLGSSAIAEGLDLKGTKLMQVLEPHFNDSKINQVIARGVRYKSHEHLPKDERKVVIKRYYSEPEQATIPIISWLRRVFGAKPKKAVGVDKWLKGRAIEKDKVMNELMEVMEEATEKKASSAIGDFDVLPYGPGARLQRRMLNGLLRTIRRNAQSVLSSYDPESAPFQYSLGFAVTRMKDLTPEHRVYHYMRLINGAPKATVDAINEEMKRQGIELPTMDSPPSVKRAAKKPGPEGDEKDKKDKKKKKKKRPSWLRRNWPWLVGGGLGLAGGTALAVSPDLRRRLRNTFFGEEGAKPVDYSASPAEARTSRATSPARSEVKEPEARTSRATSSTRKVEAPANLSEAWAKQRDFSDRADAYTEDLLKLEKEKGLVRRATEFDRQEIGGATTMADFNAMLMEHERAVDSAKGAISNLAKTHGVEVSNDDAVRIMGALKPASGGALNTDKAKAIIRSRVHMPRKDREASISAAPLLETTWAGASGGLAGVVERASRWNMFNSGDLGRAKRKFSLSPPSGGSGPPVLKGSVGDVLSDITRSYMTEKKKERIAEYELSIWKKLVSQGADESAVSRAWKDYTDRKDSADTAREAERYARKASVSADIKRRYFSDTGVEVKDRRQASDAVRWLNNNSYRPDLNGVWEDYNKSDDPQLIEDLMPGSVQAPTHHLLEGAKYASAKKPGPEGVDLEPILQLYEGADSAHQLPHINRVREVARHLATKYSPDNLRLIDLAAAIHDVGTLKDREQHEIHGENYVLSNPALRAALTKRQLATLAHAVRQHRATTGKPRSIVARIISDADRLGFNTNPLRRAYDYREGRGLGDDERLLEAAQHIAKKYAPGGKGRRTYFPETGAIQEKIYGPLIEATNKKDIKKLRELMDTSVKMASLYSRTIRSWNEVPVIERQPFSQWLKTYKVRNPFSRKYDYDYYAAWKAGVAPTNSSESSGSQPAASILKSLFLGKPDVHSTGNWQWPDEYRLSTE